MKLSNQKVAIVSLADKNYFHLLEDLISSINRFQQSKDLKICILDAGMSQEQLKKIENKVFKIKKAEWDIKVSENRIKNREWLKSQVCRPFLPNYFPEFDKIIWIDCDAWLNSWFAIEYLINASSNNKIAICSMSDRHTGRVLRVKWLFRNVGIIKSQNIKHGLASGYNVRDSQYIGTEPHLNVGVFAMDTNSEIWKTWQDNLKISLQKGRIFGSEQVALNYSIYINKCEAELIPYTCNWIPLSSVDITYWNEEKNTFVEKFYPHHEIGIMHLAGGVFVNGKDMRYDKNIKKKIRTTSGNIIEKSFRYTLD